MEWFIKMSIPILKLSRIRMKEFFAKYAGTSLLSESQYRRVHIDRLCDSSWNNIREILSSSEIYIVFNEIQMPMVVIYLISSWRSVLLQDENHLIS